MPTKNKINMTGFNVIPAIDLIDGRCVRLTQGDYGRSKVYADDPLEVAKEFEACGLGRLHLVDLDGAKASAPKNLAVLERIVSGTGLKVEFGGGIKSEASLRSVLDAGAAFAICGSVAVTEPEMFRGWLKEFGPQIILGLDLKNGKVATHGWLKTSELTAESMLESMEGLVSQVIVTDVSKDGMLQGVDAGFYSSLQAKFPEVEIIVSGGVSSLKDIEALKAAGLRSAIVGKALYEGKIKLEEL